jgi:hypothetical protein
MPSLKSIAAIVARVIGGQTVVQAPLRYIHLPSLAIFTPLLAGGLIR